jgi:hypothetical protein
MPRCMTAFVLSLPLLLACGDPDSPTVTRVWTDVPEYTLTTTSYGYEGRLLLFFTNANSFPVTIGSCSADWRGYVEMRRPADGVWVYAMHLGDILKCAGGISVPAGATLRQGVEIRFGDCHPSLNCSYYSQFPVSPITGDYRVVLEVSALPPEQVTSNTFTLFTSSP